MAKEGKEKEIVFEACIIQSHQTLHHLKAVIFWSQ